jgi:hypothetical protein
LAGLPANQLSGEERERLERGVAEYRAAQLVNADQPWAHLNLVLVQARRGLPDEAEVLFALVTINRDRGALPAAKEWARKLSALDSGEAEVARLLRELGISGGNDGGK